MTDDTARILTARAPSNRDTDPDTRTDTDPDTVTRRFAGLAADELGTPDDRPSLVLLHGLTFDRRSWRPVVEHLQRTDPGRHALVLDLPGHGDSPDASSYGFEESVERVHAAVEDARLRAPVVVGHSLGGVLATMYGALHPASGVVNVDAPPDIDGAATLLRSLAAEVRGPGFAAVWEVFVESMHVELLPADAQALVRATSNPRREVAAGYWTDLMVRPLDELHGLVAATAASLAGKRIPYHYVGGSELDPTIRQWMAESLPNATVSVWPDTGHFPHLAHPDRFAALLASTGSWPRG